MASVCSQIVPTPDQYMQALVDAMVKARVSPAKVRQFRSARRVFCVEFLQRTLDRHNGNQSTAALELGIHRNTLARYIEEYKLECNHHRGTGWMKGNGQPHS